MKQKEARKDLAQPETKYGEDITYCRDTECPLKNTCHRFALDIFGSCFMNTPRNKSDTTKQLCGFYWPKENKEEVLDKKVNEVYKPEHYTSGEMQCWDAIKASMTKEAFCGYLKGNVQKYIWRYEKKDNPAQDLEKALVYLNKLIEEFKE